MKKFTKNMLHGSIGHPKKWLLGVVMLIALTMSNIAHAQTATLGSGTATSVANSGSGLGPVNSYYAYMHYQVVYTAAEITAAGGASGLVSQFGWNVSTPSAVVLPNYSIKMAQTTATNSAAHNTATLTEVYRGDYTSTAGYNMFTLSTPFVWDGTSNILVDVCYGETDYVSPYGQVYVYGTAANSSRFSRSDYSNQCTATTDQINAFKPQARFVITEAPSCIAPTGLNISAITASSATINWNASAIVPSDGYDYYISTSATAPTASTDETGSVAGTSTPVNGLSPLTVQYVWVRGNCGNSVSDWTGPVSFNTMPNPATLPYTEDFEGAASQFTFANGSQTNKWVNGSVVSNGTGTKSLYISNDNGVTNNYSHTTSVVHAYRDITLPSDIVQANVSFDFKGAGESTYDFVRVWAVPATHLPTAGTAITTTNSNGGVMIAEYVNLREAFTRLSYIVPASVYAGQTIRLVFEWQNDGGGGTPPGAAIDNLSITTVTCFAPSAVTTVTVPGTVTVNWTAPATVPSLGYDYYYSTTNTAPTSATTVTGNVPTGTTLSLTTLPTDTVYYIWVRGNCGDNSTSVWVSGGSFRTECLASQPSENYETFTSYDGSANSPLCWKEATGVLAATPAAITLGSSSWTNENYGNATGANGLAARVELYGTRNAWLISPAIDLGNGTTDYQLEYNTIVTQWSGTNPIVMGEKYVKVVVSTDGGATWSDANVLRTYDSNNIPTSSRSEAIQLTGYSGIIKIGFYAYSTTTDQDLRFYIDNFRVRETPACLNPIAPSIGTIGEGTVQINWTAPEVAPSAGYQYYVSTANTAPIQATGGVGAGVLTANAGNLAPSTLYYVWVRSNCGDSQSEWVGPVSFTTLCDGGDILTTTDGAVCGQGSATLQATANENAVISWYAAQTGGTALGTGATFNTPEITETTDFYVSAGNVVSGLDTAVGAGASTSDTYSNPFYSLWSNNHTQHLITAQELTAAGLYAGNINSIALDVTSAGTLPMINLSVKIGTTTATGMTAFVTNASLATVYTNASYMPTTGINTLVFSTPFVWDGTSNILVEFCHGNGASGATMNRTVRTDATSYVSSVKYHVSSATAADVVCGTTTGSNLASYSVRPKFIFNGVSICNSLRQAVTATVTEAVAISATASESTICNGESSTLSVTSSNADYTYVWTPGNLAGATQTVSPTQTTTYTVTATDEASSCVTTQEVTITVNALPTTLIIAPIEQVCVNTPQALTVTGGLSASTGTVGADTTQTTDTEELTAFSNRRVSYRSQTIYTAAELLASGLQAGNIVSVAYNISTLGDRATNANYTVKIGTTSADVFANTNYLSETGFTTVYGPATYTHAVGVNTIPFTTPFVWDGVSNIVISVSHSGADSINNARTYYTDSGANTTLYNYNNLTAATGTLSVKRFNVTFATSSANAVTWSPATNLYTNAEATTPYAAGTPAATVYVKSEALSTTTYTATATTTNGCSISTSVDVTVTSTIAPAAQAAQTFCTQAAVADLEADGDNIQWYADSTGGSPLSPNASLTDGAIYYASQTVNGCESADRTAVAVTLTTVTVDTPSDVLVCVDYVLPALTNGNYYTATNGGGEMLEAGTVITETTLLYVFAQSGTCTDERNFVVTITNVVADAPSDVVTCNSYTLPVLTNGDYYTATNGGGTMLLAGEVISETTTLYVFERSETNQICTAENSFTITVTAIDPVQGVSPQTISAASAEEATIEDIVVTATGTVLWYDNENAALSSSSTPLPAGTQLTEGATYYAVQVVGECRSTQVLAVTIEAILGGKGFDASSFSYYPNPVNNELTLSYSSDITSVEVFNMLGQQVIAQKPNATTVKLNTAMLQEGTYLVKVTANNAVKTVKVVKKQ
ncbi:T9SS type A sorting domain-containing protein [Flavobacterium sp. Sd200]|uniref:Ig-like domain-containing protein n=1 Tax=Flavobacterium sp. Sd200 TaxID=2692211 RepID=UPI00136F1381|nr:T9SS type A sorting domain-containing protein [Flavobacterium sp. Sd200]MXN90052.1 T9SS type A sorting domain-containing protein [Flavobacterium sp. Sd200]